MAGQVRVSSKEHRKQWACRPAVRPSSGLSDSLRARGWHTHQSSDRRRPPKCNVLPEIESCHRNGFLRPPVANVEFALVVFAHFGARGDETKPARPPDGQVIGCKGGRIAKMRVPAFPGTHE